MLEPKPIIPNPGSERDPRNFVGRVVTTSRAMDMLKAKQSILLSDPRRMGKTFWMRTLEERLNKNDDFKAVFIDYQGVNSVEEFLTTTAHALSGSRNLPDKFPERLAALFENIDASVSLGPLRLKEAVRSSSKTSIAVLEDILSQLDIDLEKDSKKAPLVIIMDEVSDAVLTIAQHSSENEANGLLKRLRHLRSSTKNPLDNCRINWFSSCSSSHRSFYRCHK